MAKSKFTFVSPSFLTVGTDTVRIKDIVAPIGVEPCSYDVQESEGAELQVWNGGGYDLYYYINDAFDDDNDDLTGWANEQEITDATIAPGSGFWYRCHKKASNFTLSGEVSDAATITKDVYKNKFNMVGNPYPTLLDLKKVTTNIAPCSYDEQESKGVELQVWNGGGYDLYYYINDAFDDDNDDLTGWANEQEILSTPATSDVTYGFWVRMHDKDNPTDKTKAGTITFSL